MKIYNTQTNYFTKDVVIYGSLSALSGTTFTNTVFTTTSALSVVNTGFGPALYVSQTPGDYDIASFYDRDGIEVLHVGNAPSAGQKGKIGINESYPSTELTVNGSISAKNNLTVLDLFVQNNLTINNSLTSQQDIIVNQLTVGKGNSSLSGNTALGVNALYNAQITSSNDSRAFAGMNVAVGYNALSANTQGWQNVAIGYNALARNTDSREQVAVGAGVLGKSTGQGYNTAVGQSAMNETTTSQQNAAFGYATLWGNTTGNSNAACGFAVMFNNNTGANNTGLGSSALYNVYNCSNNVGVGASALRNTGQINAGQFLIGTNYTIASVGSTDFTSVGAADNNIGTAFTATGAGTGSGTVYRTSAISNNNVGVGTDALRTNSTGQNNTALGHQAGYGNNSSNATLSGNNNLFLGYRALGSDRGDSNSIVIGANAIGNGSNTLTLGDSNIARHIFTAGNVGINTTAPSERLTVNGNISANGTITASNGNSNQWNAAYNYATTYPVVTSVSYTPYNLIGALNTNTPLFTVPAGRKFICTSFGGNIIDVASSTAGGTCTVRLINSSRSSTSTIATNFTPAAANIAVIDNTNIYGNTNSVAVSGGETVSLRLANAPTGFTTLSAVMFVTGILI